MEESISEEEKEDFDRDDPRTQLIPNSKGAHRDSDGLENF